MEKRSKLNLMFFIRRNRQLKDVNRPIYVRISIDKERVDVSTGQSVPEIIWIPEFGMETGNTKEARILNRHIDKVKKGILDHYTQILVEGKEVTAKTVRNAWLGIIENERTIIGIFKEHNDQARLLINKDFSPAKVQRYETTLKHVQNYIKWRFRKNDLALSSITHDFISGLELYLKTERDCGHNTTIKYIKNFKEIVRIAMANGWLKSDPFVNHKMRLEKVDRGFLTDNELNAIRNLKLKIDRLDTVRDMFLFACFTGLSFSDLKILSPENLVVDKDGRYWIHTKRIKTDNSCHIPLLPPAKEIIQKYRMNPHCINKGVLLPIYSNQKYNAYLKEIADLAGIDKNLTSHIARHTFATTITLNNDVPIESVSKMLGHSSINMTRIYARLLDKKVGNDMSRLFDKY
jgi:integrase